MLAFAGSLRTGSYNKALLRAAESLLPENLILEIYDIDGIAPMPTDFHIWYLIISCQDGEYDFVNKLDSGYQATATPNEKIIRELLLYN